MTIKPGRPHRLAALDYVGERTVSFDACTLDRVKLFLSPEVVEPQVDYMKRAANEFNCVVPIYCFMPDHLHVMLTGLREDSNCLSAMGKFKLLSGRWMLRQGLRGWQGDFFDHIIRASDDWRLHASYIAQNPVRAGLVEHWMDYPFTGSIGADLEETFINY